METGEEANIAGEFMKLCICNARFTKAGLCMCLYTRERKRETRRIAARNESAYIR